MNFNERFGLVHKYLRMLDEKEKITAERDKLRSGQREEQRYANEMVKAVNELIDALYPFAKFCEELWEKDAPDGILFHIGERNLTTEDFERARRVWGKYE